MNPIQICVARKVQASGSIQNQLTRCFLARVRAKLEVTVLPVGKAPRHKHKIAAVSKRSPDNPTAPGGNSEQFIFWIYAPIEILVGKQNCAQVPLVTLAATLCIAGAQNYARAPHDGGVPCGLNESGESLDVGVYVPVSQRFDVRRSSA